MLIEAVKAGYYETEHGKFAKLQILTVADLFADKKPHLPWIDPNSFRKAVEEIKDKQIETK